jgi:MFS family permease
MVEEPAAGRRRFLILTILCSSLRLVSMDSTIVGVALPAIRADLGTSITGLQWTVDAYTLVLRRVSWPRTFELQRHHR